MNRPTPDVEELLCLAEEASSDGDYTHAVKILRTAAAVAPLRRDIRNRLAVALERSPSQNSEQTPKIFAAEPVNGITFDSGPDEDFQDEYVNIDSPRETISEVARKAFQAAAGTTAKAGSATRHITSLLSQGIQTWKSSLVEQAHAAGTQSISAGAVQDELAVARGTEADVFTPEKELKEYLERAANSGAGKSTGSVYTPSMDDEAEIAEIDTIKKPAPTSHKSSQPSAGKRNKRATDVEDVLAAGVGGFIEVIGNADKKKIAYGVVYVFCASIFAVACFDASRKFPSVPAVPGTNIVAASASSFGNLDLSDSLSSQQAIVKSQKLVAGGDLESAVSLLRKQLASGSILRDRDKIRVELATILNGMAEQSLTNNMLQESVERYHEALQVLPGDAALQLRLSNALYYAGTIGTSSEENKKPMLSEAKTLLLSLTAKDSADLQAVRLLALVHESLGEKELANVSWKKVRSSAPKDSDERKEAEKHLK